MDTLLVVALVIGAVFAAIGVFATLLFVGDLIEERRRTRWK